MEEVRPTLFELDELVRCDLQQFTGFTFRILELRDAQNKAIKFWMSFDFKMRGIQ